MPYKKTYRRKRNPRRNRKAKYRRKYARGARSLVRTTGFPQKMYVKLVYTERYDNHSSSAVYDKIVFRGNGVFDPNQTGTGHQPMYYDTYTSIYANYRVLGSSIKVNAVNHSGGSAIQYCIYPSTSIDTVTDISEAREQPRAKTSALIGVGAVNPDGNGYGTKHYMKTRTVYGITKAQFGSGNWSSAINTNPSSQWYWNVLVQALNSGAATPWSGNIKIIYYVEFFDRFTQGQS